MIVTAGGAASPKLGGTRDGYQLLRSLGHRCTKLHPSLVQLRTDTTYTRALKGVRAEAAVTLYRGSEVLTRQQGEVQFTDYGVSGPVIFELSRTAVTAEGPLTLSLDLLEPLSQGALVELLAEKQRLLPGLTLENLLTGVLHNRLGRTIIRYSGPEADPECQRAVPPGSGRHRPELQGFSAERHRKPGAGTCTGHCRAACVPINLIRTPWRAVAAPASTPQGKCWILMETVAASTFSGPGPAAIWRDYWGTAAAKSRKSEKTSLFFHQYSNIFH